MCAERLFGVKSQRIIPGLSEFCSSLEAFTSRSILAKGCVCTPGEGPETD